MNRGGRKAKAKAKAKPTNRKTGNEENHFKLIFLPNISKQTKMKQLF